MNNTTIKINEIPESHIIPSGWKLIVAVLICEGVGIASGLLSRSEMDNWFSTLAKPSWNPPAYLFGPVWTTLYLLMGVSLWLVWKSNAPAIKKRNAIRIFALQLFLNFWWSIIFFKLHEPGFAFIDIILMVITILLTIYQF
ncbi:MAG: TspO/MBR family protein, partial [Chitinophagaceae bacterium]